MATDLVGNEKLQRFIALLAQLNHLTVDALKTGDIKLLQTMNGVVEEMYAIQSVGEEDAYTAIEEDMQTIRQNFNAVVTMVKSDENERFDRVTGDAVKKFLKNIFQATVNIVHAYGLA